jgi:hypothetical protein
MSMVVTPLDAARSRLAHYVGKAREDMKAGREPSKEDCEMACLYAELVGEWQEDEEQQQAIKTAHK